MKMLSNWRAVLRYAWSVWLMVLAAIFSGAEIAWPYLDGFIPVSLRSQAPHPWLSRLTVKHVN